tara:strand:- start:23 stop:148 length:126 start_codon:yes stop_codon:yes gene_type:complete
MVSRYEKNLQIIEAAKKEKKAAKPKPKPKPKEAKQETPKAE